MSQRIARLWCLLPLLAFAIGCSTLPPTRRTNSALDFLYPQGITAAQPAKEVVLKLPLRVGLAFAPNRINEADPITEEQKQKLLSQVAAAFLERISMTRSGAPRMFCFLMIAARSFEMKR